MKKKVTASLEKSSSFESLLGELSAELVNLPFENVDTAIESSMKKLVDFFDADRCHLGKIQEQRSKINVPYFYSRPGINIPQTNMVGEDYLSYIFNSVKQNEIIALISPSELPDHAIIERAELERLGIKSFLILPLKIENTVQYGLSLSTVTNTLRWEKDAINQIKIIGNILTNVIQRKSTLQQIKEEKEWSEAVLEGMPQITYVFDLQGRLKRWNRDAEAILGYSAEEMKDKFIGEFYNEEDLKRVMKVVEKIIEDGRERRVEYDFVTKSGEIVPYYYGSGKLMEIGGEQYIVGQTVDISEIKQAQEKIAEQFEEIKLLKEQLEAENIHLRHELFATDSYSEIIGESDVLKYILYRVEQVAPLDTTILLEGETGTGKELFARAIHQKSNRSDKALITVNCASLPATLIESELFGHEKGAFTGALQKQIGRFELANGGTLFLDEIGEIPLELQAKLLRVLQEGEFERIGNPRTMKVDVRVIAASNRNLEQEILEGRFRKDLFYRLNVYPITIKPLRERVSDIPLLVEHFVKRLNQKMGKNIARIPRKAIEQLKYYDWPGNIRELENIIERAMILSMSDTLKVEKLKIPHRTPKNNFQTLVDHEREYIIKVLDQTLWRINGAKGAASILDMHPETLRSRMRKLGIKRLYPPA